MTAGTNPATLVHMASRYADAVKAETDAGARVSAAMDELSAAEAAYDASRAATRGARSELLNYSLNGASK